MSYKEFVQDLCSDTIICLDKFVKQRDVPDTFTLHRGLLIPIESNFGLLLKKLDHTLIHIALKDIDGMYFNWPLNDSEGYLIQLNDLSRILLKKDKAFVGPIGNLEPCSYVNQNAFQEFIFQIKVKFQRVDCSATQDTHSFKCPVWYNPQKT